MSSRDFSVLLMTKSNKKQKTKEVKESGTIPKIYYVKIFFLIVSIAYFSLSARNFYINFIKSDENEDKIIAEDPSYYIKQTFELIRNNTVKLSMKSGHLRIIISRAIRICNNESYSMYVSRESSRHYDNYINGVDKLFVLNEEVDETELISHLIILLTNMFRVSKLYAKQCRPEKLLNWMAQANKKRVIESLQSFAEVHVNTSSACSSKLFEKLLELDKSHKDKDKVFNTMKSVVIKYQNSMTETQKALIKSIEYYKGSLDEI